MDSGSGREEMSWLIEAFEGEGSYEDNDIFVMFIIACQSRGKLETLVLLR